MRGGIFQKNNILRDFRLISRNAFSYPYSHLLSPPLYTKYRARRESLESASQLSR